MSKLSHVGADGRARMVDVSDKTPTDRQASAAGFLRCAPATLDQVRAGTAPKGSVIQTAELAGVMAAKRTADLIPLCHNLPLTKAAVTIEIDDALPGFRVASEIRTHGVTGVEMEALTAVSVACLTLFDMLKAIDRTMTIGGVEVTAKTGGKSGSW
jgi:cyclic pyranopterin phosphate synthase